MNPIIAAAMTADPMMLPTVLSLLQERRATISARMVGSTIARPIGHHRMGTIVSAVSMGIGPGHNPELHSLPAGWPPWRGRRTSRIVRWRGRALGSGIDLALELFVVGQTLELIRENQRVLRGDVELLPAGLADNVFVQT